MRQKIEIFLFGAVGYTSIEVICRGRSHWSMALAGGCCLLTLFWVSQQMQRHSLLTQAIAGAAVVTVIELGVGIVVNLWLGWKVWDYTAQPLNLLGQICPRYSLYWFLLALPAMYYFRQEQHS